MARRSAKHFVGVDVGGTKILAIAATREGIVLGRKRTRTPAESDADSVVGAIEEVVAGALGKADLTLDDVAGVGLAIPGVVDPDAGDVVMTPNMGLSGVPVASVLGERISARVSLGNDANLGALGESWLGAARGAESAVGIFVGTGIGAGLIRGGELIRGARETAGEIGHMIMELGGPRCGCGGRGCFEALASRTAMERDIRRAIAKGEDSLVESLMKDKDDRIRSSVLRKALAKKDPVVRRVMRRACDVIGLACQSVRHLCDPEAIVLGGGVLEACGNYMMPRIEKRVKADPLAGAGGETRLLLSPLGDDAVALGAVAIARRDAGLSTTGRGDVPAGTYPRVERTGAMQVQAGGKTLSRNGFVRVDTKVKKLKHDLPADGDGKVHLHTEALKRACKGGPEILFVGSDAPTDLSPQAGRYARYHAIETKVADIDEAIRDYAGHRGRKALLLRLEA